MSIIMADSLGVKAEFGKELGPVPIKQGIANMNVYGAENLASEY